MWLLIDRPLATYFYPTRADNFLICSAYINHSYIVAFFYPLMIIGTCTVYAVLTRKIPGDFNESKCRLIIKIDVIIIINITVINI